MAHDLQRGNRLELEWLSGGVAQLGAAAGVPTPANRAVWTSSRYTKPEEMNAPGSRCAASARGLSRCR